MSGQGGTINEPYIADKDALIYAPLSVFSLVIEYVPCVNSGSNLMDLLQEILPLVGHLALNQDSFCTCQMR